VTRVGLLRGARAAVAAFGLAGAAALAAEGPAGSTPCRLPGVEHGALCGVLTRPLDPTAPQGRSIEVHFAVLPSLSRNKKADPVFFFAGGPGQSALALAGPVSQLLGRLQNRRDIVLIDQRGTGRSAPLQCADAAPTRPLAEQFDPQRQIN
jgi:pimeloyl-ACP methyl ester carboxylesterase